jgi:sodium transport system permease protein
MIVEIVKKEIRDVVRDKKTLIMMIIVPLILYPLMFGTLLMMEDSMMTVDESEYNTIGFAFDIDEAFDTVIEEMEIQKVVGNESELREKFDEGEIDAYITLKDKEFTIYYTEEDMYGQGTLELAYKLIEGYKQAIQSQMLTSEGLIPDEIFNVYTVEVEDISETNAYTEMMLSMVPTFILMTTTLTAIFAAIDMTAGEKERGTLETLLTFPLRKNDIIGGKFFATTICTVISAILGFLSMYGVLYYLSSTLESFKGMELLTYRNFVLALIMFVIYSMLISAIAIAIASKAKSFKEAQNSTQPIAIFSMFPMFFSIMGIKLDNVLSLIPFANVNLLLSDIFSNAVNMQYFVLTIFSNIIFIFIAMKAVIKLFKSDKILFS